MIDETLVFHLTRTQAAIAAGVVIAALLVFAWIGSRASKTAEPADAPQRRGSDSRYDCCGSRRRAAAALGDAAARTRERPQAGPAGEGVAGRGGRSPRHVRVMMRNRRRRPSATAGSRATVAKPGLNYLVIQIIPDRPDAEEHAAAVRKFLATKGIRTIAVPGDNGGIKIMSEQGFNWDDPSDGPGWSS